MLIMVLIGIAIVVLVLVAVIATQPADFRISRTATVSAPASSVFAQVNDFHKWRAWNPFAEPDPAMQETYEGAAAGTGAIYLWSGNKRVGAGRMTMLESRPNELIRIKLEFMKPFAATNTAEFTFKSAGNQTAVTWSMEGKRTFFFKAFNLVMNGERMIGGAFEKGLAKLKTAAEPALRS